MLEIGQNTIYLSLRICSVDRCRSNGALQSMFSQTTAVQECFAANFALLSFAAIETNVRFKRRQFAVIGSTQNTDVRFQRLRLVKHRSGIEVTIIISMFAEKSRMRERLAAILAHVLPFRLFRILIKFRASRNAFCAGNSSHDS